MIKMPGINREAQKIGEQIVLDVLTLKVGELLEMNFKDGPITLQRVK